MPDDGEPFRDGLTDYLQANAPHAVDHEAICTGWALVTEWMHPDGERYLAKCHAPNVADWSAKGMHHEAMAGDWPDEYDD